MLFCRYFTVRYFSLNCAVIHIYVAKLFVNIITGHGYLYAYFYFFVLYLSFSHFLVIINVSKSFFFLVCWLNERNLNLPYEHLYSNKRTHARMHKCTQKFTCTRNVLTKRSADLHANLILCEILGKTWGLVFQARSRS